MNKKISIIIIVACTFLMSGLFFYYENFVAVKSVDASEISEKKIFPLKIPQWVEEPTQEVIAPPKEENPKFSLLAVGDIMLDRSVMLKTQEAKDYNHPFLLIDPLFKEYDLHLANLEGPITTNKSIANGTGGARFTFTFSPNFVEPLKNRFQFLSLANNHELNFGQKGIAQTRNYLQEAGVHYFGDPENKAGFAVTTTYNGISLGFVGYHQLVETGFDSILREIAELEKQVDVLIVMPHWGTEYVLDKPTPLQKQEGHAMIDAGADIIIGAHPHVIEPIEMYKDKVIFYSLGNFVFDQYFSPETMTGLAVGMQFEKISNLSLRAERSDLKNQEIASSPSAPRNDSEGSIKVTYHLIPLDINAVSQPSVATDVKKQTVLQLLQKYSFGDDNFKQNIASSTFNSFFPYGTHQ